MHTNIGTNSSTLYFLSDSLFSEYAVDWACIRKPKPWLYVYPHTLTLAKNLQDIAQIQKPISDSRFYYNVFAKKTHNRIPFKNSIANFWFLTMYSLTLKPIRATCSPLTSAYTCSLVPSCYFVKRVKPKFTVIYS